MSVIVNNISMPVGADKQAVIEKARKLCSLSSSQIKTADIHKTSLDARRRNNIHFVHAVYFELFEPQDEMKLCAKNAFCKLSAPAEIKPVISNQKRSGRVVVAGFGPAGMFCALLLAKMGYRPLVLEKGAAVEKRDEKVSHFWKTGELDENTNVQFGEGGAGTFSDGKLTTRIKDPLCRYVLEAFAQFGADKSILCKAKPHIGTDVLKTVVKNIRSEIISLGGEICFETPLEGITVRNGSVFSVSSGRGAEECSALVIACGHSAGDTFRLLHSSGILLEPKPFSVGVRIEHSQQSVNESLYGAQAENPLLPVGEYQLSHRNKEGRGVYTFCMCPGGTIVAAASERGAVVTNGMSEFSRGGRNANAAIAVSVSPSDFGGGTFDGFDFAKKIERRAYEMTGSGYAAPATTVGGFLSGSPSLKNMSVEPTYQRGLAPCELRELFPKYVSDMLEEGLHVFARKMRCYGDMGAVLTAPETRTSSPIKIPRGELAVSSCADNLYPCGEGAGYAGGIMSAAVDGLKTALQIMAVQSPLE
jgi:hypothetical protein